MCSALVSLPVSELVALSGFLTLTLWQTELTLEFPLTRLLAGELFFLGLRVISS